MSITRVGTSQKYASGWDKAFGGMKKKAVAKRGGAIAHKKATASRKKQATAKKKAAPRNSR